MTLLYRYELHGLDHDPWLTTGQPVTVEGTPMVRLPHGVIVSAAGFHADKADAQRAVAEVMDKRITEAAAKAAKYREGIA